MGMMARTVSHFRQAGQLRGLSGSPGGKAASLSLSWDLGRGWRSGVDADERSRSSSTSMGTLAVVSIVRGEVR